MNSPTNPAAAIRRWTAARLALLGPLCVAALALAGCASGGDQRGEQRLAFGSARPVILEPLGLVDPPPNPTDAEVPLDTPRVVVTYGEAASQMALVSRRTETVSDDAQTTLEQYATFGGVRMTLRDGMLARLRGLGLEYEALILTRAFRHPSQMLTVDAPALSSERFMEYWVNQNPFRDRLSCEYALGAPVEGFRQVVERCFSVYDQARRFQNLYFFDGNGVMRVSRQWFHPKAEHPVVIIHLDPNGS